MKTTPEFHAGQAVSGVLLTAFYSTAGYVVGELINKGSGPTGALWGSILGCLDSAGAGYKNALKNNFNMTKSILVSVAGAACTAGVIHSVGTENIANKVQEMVSSAPTRAPQ